MKYLLPVLTGLCLLAPYPALSDEANEAIEPSAEGPGSIDLLGGGTLDNWDVPSDHWYLENRSIVGNTGTEEIDVPEWIYTKKAFGDFIFTCELKLTGDRSRNSGIYYRVNTFTFEGRETFEAPSGYEFDAAFHKPDKKDFRGSLGDWYARPSLRIFPDPNIVNQAYITGGWNRMTIRARGSRLEHWINGVKILDYRDADPEASREGIIGFQIHNGSVMKVEYRDIHVRPL